MGDGDKVFVPNSFQTPNVYIDEVMACVSGAALKILMAITRYILGWHHNGGVQMGYDVLKTITGLSHQGIINGAQELTKFGLVLIQKGPRGSSVENTYFLNLDLTTGELVKKVDYSKKLSRGGTQKSRLVLVKKVDSLKILNKGNKVREADAGASSTHPRDSLMPDSENQRGIAAAGDDGFERAWSAYPKRAGGNSKKAAHAKWQARLGEGVKADELLAGVERYARYVRATAKEGTELVMQAQRFFGPNEEWENDWMLPANGGRAAGGFVA